MLFPSCFNSFAFFFGVALGLAVATFFGITLGFFFAATVEGFALGLAFPLQDAFAFALGAPVLGLAFFWPGVSALGETLPRSLVWGRPLLFALLFAAHFAVGRAAWLGGLSRNQGEGRGEERRGRIGRREDNHRSIVVNRRQALYLGPDS